MSTTHNYFTVSDSLRAAESIAAAVIRKAYNASCSEDMKRLRAELQRDKAIFERQQVFIDPEAVNPSSLAASPRGYDLVIVAWLAIKAEARKYAARHGLNSLRRLPSNWMKDEYTQNKLKTRVMINGKEAEYKTETTSATRETARAVRRAIEAERAPRDNSKYLYLDAPTEDGIPAAERAYIRLNRAADLGGYECTLNGYTTYTASEEIATYTAAALDSLRLTARQAAIMQYRLKGYGYKAIAAALGVTDSAIKGQIAEIRRKAAAIGLTAERAAAVVTAREEDERRAAAEMLTPTERKHAEEDNAAATIAAANIAEAAPNPIKRTSRAANIAAAERAAAAEMPSECITYTMKYNAAPRKTDYTFGGNASLRDASTAFACKMIALQRRMSEDEWNALFE